MKKVYFGWFIVVAALLLTTYSSLGFIFGFTAFVTPIAATFGWSYAQVSFASSIRGLETGTLDPFLGIAADRWPARRLVFIGICILAIGTILISQATNLAIFYLGFLVVGLGSATSVFMVPTTVIARWFKRNIGKANGILAMGFALGGLFVPLLVKVIDTYGWQDTLIYMAAGTLILGIPLSLVFRSRPEEYGLLPDGEAQNDVKGPSPYDFGTGVKEALKMRAFWHIGLSLMFQMGAMWGVSIHVMPYLTSLGMERSSAADAVWILSLASLAARLPFGVFADIFTKKYVMALSMGLTAVGLVIFGLIDGSSFALVVLFAIIYGIGSAGVSPLRAPIIREYFGVKKFGTIYGLLAVFTTIGSATSAPVAGWVFDIRGVYDPIWFVFAGLAVVGMILILIVPPASRKAIPVVS
ncbi:MFS transporter [Chloroflexota bacterium]